MSVLCHPSVQPNHAAVDTSADPAQRRRVHALSLFRLWRDVLTDQLGALCLRTHSSNHTLCGIPLTTLLHLAIVHNKGGYGDFFMSAKEPATYTT